MFSGARCRAMHSCRVGSGQRCLQVSRRCQSTGSPLFQLKVPVQSFFDALVPVDSFFNVKSTGSKFFKCFSASWQFFRCKKYRFWVFSMLLVPVQSFLDEELWVVSRKSREMRLKKVEKSEKKSKKKILWKLVLLKAHRIDQWARVRVEEGIQAGPVSCQWQAWNLSMNWPWRSSSCHLGRYFFLCLVMC